jgi:amino acid transporter
MGIDVPGWVLQWLVAIVLIWGISVLNIRGARLSGLTTDWLGLIMMLPLLFMSGFGLYAWISGGYTISLPFLPNGEPVTFQSLLPALSTGLFVAMWNFMGWELPTAAGDEIVNPKRTYPIAMVLVLVITIATHSIPTVTGLYGGAGSDGKYLLWGAEASDENVGIEPDMAEYGIGKEKFLSGGLIPKVPWVGNFRILRMLSVIKLLGKIAPFPGSWEAQ